jgi:hypothetical protein
LAAFIFDSFFHKDNIILMVFSAKNKIIFDGISLRTPKLILSIFAGLIELAAEIYIALFFMARKVVENNIDLFSAAFPLPPKIMVFQGY